jgi:thiamine-monophosphate kinase
MDRTELEKLGEFGLIKHLTANFKTTQPSTIKGAGDDAAVIDCGDSYRLITTDMLLEGLHFDLMYAPLKHLGYKAAVVNFSDIYAMNGKPTHIVVSIGLSNRFSLEAVEELYAGIMLAAETYGVDIVGGDTTSSKSGLVISITAYGEVAKDKVVYRNGAKDKDLLVVSGDLGAAFMGLQVLERERAVFKSEPAVQPDLEGNDYILERQLKPEARKDVIELLEKLDVVPTSMIDISDGLASEILHICDQSKTGAQIYEDKLPIDPTTVTAAEKFEMAPSVCALSGGEDYELLFSIKQEDFEKLKGNPALTFIGHIEEGSAAQMVSRDGSTHKLSAQGWDAFLEEKQK